MLTRGKDGRLRNGGRFATANEVREHEKAHGGGGASAVAEVEVVIDETGKGRGRRGHHPSQHGGHHSIELLRWEQLKRLRIEDSWDFSQGLLDGLQELCASGSAPAGIRARAAALYQSAHPAGGQGREARRDSQQYELGRQIAQIVGPVAVYLGWTPETWSQACPSDVILAASEDAATVASGFVPDDGYDAAAGGVGGALGSIAGGALGSLFGPEGTAAGAALGGALGAEVGVAVSNYSQGHQAGDRAAQQRAAMLQGIGVDPNAGGPVVGTQGGLFL